MPIGVTSSERPPLDRVDSLLFVVDTMNYAAGRDRIDGAVRGRLRPIAVVTLTSTFVTSNAASCAGR